MVKAAFRPVFAALSRVNFRLPTSDFHQIVQSPVKGDLFTNGGWNK